MTLDEMLKLARYCAKCCEQGSDGERLGIAVLDLLGEAAPCGLEEPTLAPAIAKPTLVDVPVTWCEAVPPDQCRAMAVMLLRAADEAE